eukprot:730805-Prorocentrum_minimum.AAC.1
MLSILLHLLDTTGLVYPQPSYALPFYPRLSRDLRLPAPLTTTRLSHPYWSYCHPGAVAPQPSTPPPIGSRP